MATGLITLCLCFATLIDFTTSENVRVYNMQTNVFRKPTSDVFLKFDLQSMISKDKQKPVSSMTVCYHVKVTLFRNPMIIFSYGINEAMPQALVFGQYGTSKLYTMYAGKFLREGEDGGDIIDLPNKWSHVCHVFNQLSHTYYFNGIESSTNDLLKHMPMPLNGTLYIGQLQELYQQIPDAQESFSGSIAQIAWWNRALEVQDILKLKNCGQLPFKDSLILSSDNPPIEFESYNDIDLGVICQKTSAFLFLTSPMTQRSAYEQCKTFNLTLTTPGDSQHSEILFQESENFMKECKSQVTGKFWIGITDNDYEGLWIDINTEDVVDNVLWKPGYPRSDTDRDCAAMDQNSSQIVDTQCHRKLCFACNIEPLDTLYVRGLCYEQEDEIQFYMAGYNNSKIFLVGYFDDVILYDGSHWILWNRERNVVRAQWKPYLKDFYPLGKRKWTVLKPLCGYKQNESIFISISPCDFDEFMCNNGKCIPKDSRCNAGAQCEDRSDEADCSFIRFPKTYSKSKPPSSGELNKPLFMNFSVYIDRLDQFDEVGRSFQAEFYFVTSWYDEDLTFLNLLNSSYSNVIEPSQRDRLWIPNFDLSNVKNGKSVLIKSQEYIELHGESNIMEFNNIHMDTIYSYEQATLQRMEWYSSRFFCDFHLFRYPFDEQTCSMDVLSTSAIKQVVAIQESHCFFRSDHSDSVFTVRNCKMREIRPHLPFSTASATLVLDRKYGIILLKIFAPMIMLFSIAYFTLFVRVSLLVVRGAMSLTTLLVMYTFFNQVSSSLPKTGSIMMIDIWFFFFIVLTFVLIGVHVAADYYPSELETPVFKSASQKKKASFWTCGTRMTAEKFLRYTRYIFVPITMLVFQIVFWVIMLNK